MENANSRFIHLFDSRQEDGDFIFRVKGQSHQVTLDIPAHSLIIKYYMSPEKLLQSPICCTNIPMEAITDFIELSYTLLSPEDLKEKDRILALYLFSTLYGNERLDNLLWPKIEALINFEDAVNNWSLVDWEELIRLVKKGAERPEGDGVAHLDTLITAICSRLCENLDLRRRLLKLALLEDVKPETSHLNVNSQSTETFSGENSASNAPLINGLGMPETSDNSRAESEAATAVEVNSTLSSEKTESDENFLTPLFELGEGLSWTEEEEAFVPEVLYKDPDEEADEQDVDSLFESPKKKKKRASSRSKSSTGKKQKLSPSSEVKHVYLTTSEISAPGVSDWSAVIDTNKWKEIVEAQSTDTIIHLPAGKFSFPDRYKINGSNLTISGSDGAKTELCWLRPAGKKNTPDVLLYLGENVSLQNLSFRVSSLEDDKAWPYLVLDKGSCRVQDVSFFGCGIYIKSVSNVIEDVRVFGNRRATGDEPLKARKSKIPPSVIKTSIAIKLKHIAGRQPQNEGEPASCNVLNKISVHETLTGISKEIKWTEGPENLFQARMSNLSFKGVKYGLTLHNCFGDKVEKVSYEWLWETHGPTPAAVKIYSGEGIEVDGVTCSGKGKFSGVCLHLGKDGAPRENLISNVTGGLCWLYGFQDVKGFGENKFINCGVEEDKD